MCYSFHYPRAILHIDGDAFFASCEQARDPKLKGKPVVTGKERGIAASMSYEAKARGVTRAMSLREIKKICPEAIILPSDYETYSLLSERLYSIVRRYTPEVEEYGIDECFADLTGLRRYMQCSYPDLAKQIKHELDTELGFTFSVGLAPSKTLAKIASKWRKPSGLTLLPGTEIGNFLPKVKIDKVWGIGPNTAAFLRKFNVGTAAQFVARDEQWVNTHLTKPHQEIWRELQGRAVYALDTRPKESYASIQKVKTFTPPSTEKRFVFSQLAKNIENACLKARRYQLETDRVIFFLRTQQFRDMGMEIRLSRPSSFPHEIIAAVEPYFARVFHAGVEYRSTGIILGKLVVCPVKRQAGLFEPPLEVKKFERLYESADAVRQKYGKHTLFLGTSFWAQTHAQHAADRGEIPTRYRDLLPGETKRRHLGLPMFMGEVG